VGGQLKFTAALWKWTLSRSTRVSLSRISRSTNVSHLHVRASDGRQPSPPQRSLYYLRYLRHWPCFALPTLSTEAVHVGMRTSCLFDAIRINAKAVKNALSHRCANFDEIISAIYDIERKIEKKFITRAGQLRRLTIFLGA
jgi:hypothetical protein